MLRRLAVASALVTVALLLLASAGTVAARSSSSGDRGGDATTTTESGLPGTTLEAQERDDGSTATALWIIGSGIAALAAIGIGGVILQRRSPG